MIETREKYIEGSAYSVTQLPARRAIRLKAKLIKLFGPVLAQLFSGASTEGMNSNTIVSAVELLSSHIEEVSFENLVVELLTGVRKNGMELTPATIDLEFAGDMGTLYQVLWFVVEVNFSNFFTLLGIGNLFSETQAPTPQAKTEYKKTFTRT